MPYVIRPAERRDLAALSALAAAQGRERHGLDPRMAASPQIIPFLSSAQTLGDVLSWRHHVTLVAQRGGVVGGGINLHRVEQGDHDPFATYYPRRFTSIGLLAAPDPETLAALLTRAREQAARWKTPSLLVHNASADRVMHDALSAFGFRLYYYYALRPPQGASGPPAQGGTEAPPADPEVSVRRAGRGDLEAVVRLGMESVHYHASLEPTMRVPRDEGKKMRRRFETVLAEPGESTIFVAELQRQIAGFYSIYLQSIDDSWTPPLFAPGRYGLIAEVAVDPRFRKRGIGHRLFDAASQWFHERGARSFWLIYLPANPLSSRFWTSLGFAPVWEVLLQDEGGPLC